MRTRSLKDIHAERAALMERLILEFVVGQGIDVSEGISPDQRRYIADDAELAYDDWCQRCLSAGKPLPSDGSPIQNLLSELYEVDDLIYAMMEGGRQPDEPLQ
jgi:hypothetical protein